MTDHQARGANAPLGTPPAIHVEKLTPHVGGEISGVDLSEPLDERTFKEIHDALIDNGVIFFRDHRVTVRGDKPFYRG